MGRNNNLGFYPFVVGVQCNRVLISLWIWNWVLLLVLILVHIGVRKTKIPIFLDLAQKAIEHFNSEHNTNYKFVKNLTVNTSTAAGIWCYITFLATDATDTDNPNAPKTFQALAWWGVDFGMVGSR